MVLTLLAQNLAGRPFLNGRLECDDPRLFDQVAFLLDQNAEHSFVTSKVLRTRPLPSEIVGAKFYTTMPLASGTLEEYEITFRKLSVVEYSESNPLPCTLGRDFLSVCPLATVEGEFLVQMKGYKVTIATVFQK